MVNAKKIANVFIKTVGPSAIRTGIKFSIEHYNKLALNGEKEKVKFEMRKEFLKNRKIAQQLFESYKDKMNDELKALYEEFIKEC
jgi:hypothetical protein